MFNLRRVSFGAPAAIVTSMALIVGLDAATANKATVVGSLLIAGLADNLTDSLTIHIYQEFGEAGRTPSISNDGRQLYCAAGRFPQFYPAVSRAADVNCYFHLRNLGIFPSFGAELYSRHGPPRQRAFRNLETRWRGHGHYRHQRGHRSWDREHHGLSLKKKVNVVSLRGRHQRPFDGEGRELYPHPFGRSVQVAGALHAGAAAQRFGVVHSFSK